MSENTPSVLIVDDEPSAKLLLSSLFKNHGYETHSASNGTEALQSIRENPPDLILLDVMMPGLGGLEVLEVIRQDPNPIPTILVTADERTATLEQGMQLGAEDLIKKPVNPREILARAASKLEANRLRRDLNNRTKDLEALLHVSEELNRHLLQVDELLRLLMQLVVDLLPCQIATIHHFDEQGEVRHNFTLRPDGQAIAEPIPYQAIMEDFYGGSPIIQWDNHRVKSSYACGIAANLEYVERTHGLIILLADTPFDADQQRLFAGIARQATLALHNAEAYQLNLHYAEHLENMVEERTQELRETQHMLIQSEKLASIGRLAAGIAHEINNPLMPIILTMEDVVEDINANQVPDTRATDLVMESARRIKRIVERLMQFTKQGSADTHMEPTQLPVILEDVAALSHKLLQQGNVQLTTDLKPDSTIMANTDQLQQVFLNMILNAQSAMPNGGHIHIQSHHEQQMLVIKIEDNGSGIKADIMDKIFEPFFGTRPDSNGLGLFLSYQIVENHQGSIQVESEVGKGTRFTLRFPLCD